MGAWQYFRLIVAIAGLAVIFFSWKTGHLTDGGTLLGLTAIAVASLFAAMASKGTSR